MFLLGGRHRLCAKQTLSTTWTFLSRNDPITQGRLYVGHEAGNFMVLHNDSAGFGAQFDSDGSSLDAFSAQTGHS